MFASKNNSVFNVLVVFVLVLLFSSWPPRVAQATYKSISVLKSPQAPLSLVANTITVIPGTYCTVIVRNPVANPVYWGGPASAGVTNQVNTAGSLAICTDTTLCESDILSVNVMSGGISLLSTINTTVRYTVGEGCQP